MADFQQTGPITTLHRLRPECVPALERRLEECARQTSIGLVLPALYSEFETPAMAGIAEQLAEVRYLSRIVVSLDRANAMQYERVKAFFRRFRTPVTVLWNDGGAVQSALAAIAARGLPIGVQGKGRGCWTAYGYLLARGDCDVIALHDCDIVDYDRSMLARLIQPLADPRFGYDFCKGYYARTNHRMNGRVTRLYIAPLVRALERMQPGTGFLDFFRAFRYPLAGEFAMRASLARVNRIPCDWGLEAGFLAEVYRNCPPSRVCQADIADTYEHKHQPLSPEDRSKGLRRIFHGGALADHQHGHFIAARDPLQLLVRFFVPHLDLAKWHAALVERCARRCTGVCAAWRRIERQGRLLGGAGERLGRRAAALLQRRTETLLRFCVGRGRRVGISHAPLLVDPAVDLRSGRRGEHDRN
jgi:glucosyl-3-phosphoglycerate synthase